jgi:hypothetical protein
MVRVSLFGALAVVLLTLMGTQQATTTPATPVSDCGLVLQHSLELLQQEASFSQQNPSPYSYSLVPHALDMLRAVVNDDSICQSPTQPCTTTILLTPDAKAATILPFAANVWNRYLGCVKFLVGPVGSEPFPTSGGLNFITVCQRACIKTENQGLTYWNGLGQEGGDTAIWSVNTDVLIHELGHQLGDNDSPHDCKCLTGSPLCVMDASCLAGNIPWLTIR